MLFFILSLILAIVIAFLFTLDANPATLHIGTTTLADVPLFYIVFVSIVIGVLLGSVTTIVNLIKSKLTIVGKNSDLKKSYETTEQLQEKVETQEEEKTVLKEQIKELKSTKK